MSEPTTSNARQLLARVAKIAYSITTGPQRPVDHLATLAAIRRMLDQAERDLVAGARAERASWGKIGRALGITRQSARERFGLTQARRQDDPDQWPLWPYEPTTPEPTPTLRSDPPANP